MKKSSGVVHVIAQCTDCDWECNDYLSAREQAIKHAKKYRHIVKGDIGLAFTYDGKICPHKNLKGK